MEDSILSAPHNPLTFLGANEPRESRRQPSTRSTTDQLQSASNQNSLTKFDGTLSQGDWYYFGHFVGESGPRNAADQKPRDIYYEYKWRNPKT
ncbi:hypothetical protein M5D96_006465 [Drosophila gunungcola]|uniref:Uncharacterized protein n=1 Tax=Drosophila gunungcola TaxID=103775 RepID=A0A9Q0BQ63_9MUSC|nr:hypothetical protein M5D96_006465 [Drosophila gunungcola]